MKPFSQIYPYSMPIKLTQYLGLCFLLMPMLVWANPPETSRDQTEWKTYQQRLNKFSQAIQKKKTAEVRTLQQALMVDVRREIAQSRGRNASLPQSQITPEAQLRMDRMRSINTELRKLSKGNYSTQKDPLRQMVRLFKEFGQLMKAEIER
ncbi:MAG: hypothetical protein AAF399_04535 [Bacteroidota bacterium]